jgi:anaerobic selenocysteine-containing dehydrogenase
MKQKVIKVGKHSLAAIIPAKFVHALGIKAGDWVNVKTNTQAGRISLLFSGVMQLVLPSSESNKKSK